MTILSLPHFGREEIIGIKRSSKSREAICDVAGHIAANPVYRLATKDAVKTVVGIQQGIL